MTIERRRLATALAPQPLSRFSPGVRAGILVQVSGQGPLDPVTGEVTDLGNVTAQTTATLEIVRSILQQGGASMSDVIMLRIYLTDRAHFADMNTAYERFIVEHVGDEVAPARTTVVVGLPLEGMLVEIDALAVTNNP